MVSTHAHRSAVIVLYIVLCTLTCFHATCYQQLMVDGHSGQKTDHVLLHVVMMVSSHLLGNVLIPLPSVVVPHVLVMNQKPKSVTEWPAPLNVNIMEPCIMMVKKSQLIQTMMANVLGGGYLCYCSYSVVVHTQNSVGHSLNLFHSANLKFCDLLYYFSTVILTFNILVS